MVRDGHFCSITVHTVYLTQARHCCTFAVADILGRTTTRYTVVETMALLIMISVLNGISSDADVNVDIDIDTIDI